MSDKKKIIKDYPNYQACKNGFIYNKKGKKLKPYVNFGYEIVSVYNKEGVRKSRRVHRLIALTYLPKKKGKNCVNHKDGNRSNNKLSNLEWVNHSENNKHSYQVLGRDSHFKGKKGAKHNLSKAILQISLDGKIIREFGSALEAEREIGVNSRLIGQVALGNNKTSGGYKWKYKEDIK